MWSTGRNCRLHTRAWTGRCSGLFLGGTVTMVVASFVAWRWILPLWGLQRLLPCICASHGQKTVCNLKTCSLKTRSIGGTAAPDCC